MDLPIAFHTAPPVQRTGEKENKMANVYSNYIRVYGQKKSETLQAEHLRILLFGSKSDDQIYQKHGVYPLEDCNPRPSKGVFRVDSKYGPIGAEVLQASLLLPKLVFFMGWDDSSDMEGLLICQDGKILVDTQEIVT